MKTQRTCELAAAGAPWRGGGVPDRLLVSSPAIIGLPINISPIWIMLSQISQNIGLKPFNRSLAFSNITNINNVQSDIAKYRTEAI